MPIRAVFRDLTPWNCDVIVLTPKVMQLTQKHAFWRITRQSRSNGLTPSGAKEQTKNKKTQTINISRLCGDHAPEPIDMPFSVLTPVTDIIIHAKFYVDSLNGFWEGAPPKVPFRILFGTTVTTVLQTVITTAPTLLTGITQLLPRITSVQSLVLNTRKDLKNGLYYMNCRRFGSSTSKTVSGVSNHLKIS